MRISSYENDPGYTAYASRDIQVSLPDFTYGTLLFLTADEEKREVVIFVYDKEGKKLVNENGDCLTTLLTDVTVVIVMPDDLRAAIIAERAQS